MCDRDKMMVSWSKLILPDAFYVHELVWQVQPSEHVDEL